MDMLREKMYKAIEEFGVSSNEALIISQELDVVIVNEQKTQYLNSVCRGDKR